MPTQRTPDDAKTKANCATDPGDEATQPMRDSVNGLEGDSDHDLTSMDKARFVRLWATHKRRVYAYVLSLVPNWADADEVFQETNIRLWRDFSRFDGETDFGTWAVSVAYYQVLTWRKRQSRNRLVFDDETINAIAEQHGNLLPVTDARFGALRDCFQELHGRQRELITKFYAPGASIEELGNSVGKTRAAVYKALQRIRASLRTCIERRLKRDQIT